MPFSESREYRATMEFRAVEPQAQPPAPQGGDGEPAQPQPEPRPSYIIEGYATTFDEPYDFEGQPGEREVVLRAAFDGCDMADVIFQFDHQGMVMARVRNASLSLMLDDHGLLVRADLSGTEQGRQLYEAVRNGLIDRMSWGFIIADDGYHYDWETHTATISKVSKVYDVSAVSIPANQATEIYARSARLDGEIEKAREEFARRAAARRALALKAKAVSIR